MEVCLDGRSAIITGSSKGLGLAMAKEFAASGADVAILARNPETLAEAKATVSAGASGRVATFSCDVSKADDIQKTFDAVIATFGKVDILVNNAGQSRAMPSTQITDAIWQEDLELKLFAAIRLARLVWPGMQERKWGRIINVLNSGAKAPRANGAPTAVSRAAGMALMKMLAPATCLWAPCSRAALRLATGGAGQRPAIA
jgi:NAD(P)-dependent dehydrogenase (short-subunit alcohol dehydrogenase family)